MADISISRKSAKKALKADRSRSGNESAIRAMRADFQTAGGGDEEARPKKRLRKLILLIVALLAVGGIAGSVWLFLLQPPESEGEVVAAEPDVFPKTYIPTEPVHIAFVQRDGVRRRLIVFLTLEVEQRGRNASRVHQALPKLQEAFWRNLNAEPLPGAETGAIELTAVKERIRAESEKVLGPDVVTDVLIRDARLVRG
jgi:flagellar basal body-associated protein FliL